ncbi:hypothetical protein AVEN_93625-1 [Araneus ventricosus]|uniref:Uncharacterized protein n=1 Tax=Araneus ventricosus TaxID=182803 RepID=A0A4Y2SKZ1_ARAVE|nr:hypothetical protein AVEN_93625-1 [Araneus ventricosus]
MRKNCHPSLEQTNPDHPGMSKNCHPGYNKRITPTILGMRKKLPFLVKNYWTRKPHPTITPTILVTEKTATPGYNKRITPTILGMRKKLPVLVNINKLKTDSLVDLKKSFEGQ